MIGTFWQTAAKLSLLAMLGFPQISEAGTTTADFLTWERSQQDSFFQISMLMLVTVSTQVHPEFSECVSGWYFGDEDKTELNAELLRVMQDFKEFSPSAFVLGYAEGVCGKVKS